MKLWYFTTVVTAAVCGLLFGLVQYTDTRKPRCLLARYYEWSCAVGITQ